MPLQSEERSEPQAPGIYSANLTNENEGDNRLDLVWDYLGGKNLVIVKDVGNKGVEKKYKARKKCLLIEGDTTLRW